MMTRMPHTAGVEWHRDEPLGEAETDRPAK